MTIAQKVVFEFVPLDASASGFADAHATARNSRGNDPEHARARSLALAALRGVGLGFTGLHVVGWRFINDRRAVNLDPNCDGRAGKRMYFMWLTRLQ